MGMLIAHVFTPVVKDSTRWQPNMAMKHFDSLVDDLFLLISHFGFRKLNLTISCHPTLSPKTVDEFFPHPRSGNGFHMPDGGATELGPCSAKT
jgi:hypothetical protein